MNETGQRDQLPVQIVGRLGLWLGLGMKLTDVVDELRARARIALNIPVMHAYDGFTIEFPPQTRIPHYQRRFPKYDRFLPHLARYLDAGSAVIDVGANVGDTLAGMAAQNDRLVFVCVEADDGFFRRLLSNVARVEKAKPSVRTYAVKALAGTTGTGLALVETFGGTKHAVVQDGGDLVRKPLDQLVSELPESLTFRLIKSDVDGFDYDVINSASSILHRDKPLVYFECQTDTADQMAGYKAMFGRMVEFGYRDWTLFDNFGEVVLRTHDLGLIDQLLQYVWQQNQGRTARTVYYYDVLAAQPDDTSLLDSALLDYA